MLGKELVSSALFTGKDKTKVDGHKAFCRILNLGQVLQRLHLPYLAVDHVVSWGGTELKARTTVR